MFTFNIADVYLYTSYTIVYKEHKYFNIIHQKKTKSKIQQPEEKKQLQTSEPCPAVYIEHFNKRNALILSEI